MPITPQTLFEATWIMAGIYIDARLCWMVIYEYKCKDDGMKYLRGEKRNGKHKNCI